MGRANYKAIIIFWILRAKLVRAGITTKSTKPLRSPAKLDLADRERTFADNAVRKWKIELTMV